MPVASLPPAIYRSAPAARPGPAAVATTAGYRPGAALRLAPIAYRETGIASWYGPTRRVTASGERYNPRALTAAHRWLPLNTVIRVTDLDNGRSVTVRINDRGPYVRGRILDLSARAANILHMRGQGIAPVRIVVIGRGPLRYENPPPVARRGFDASSMTWVAQTE